MSKLDWKEALEKILEEKEVHTDITSGLEYTELRKKDAIEGFIGWLLQIRHELVVGSDLRCVVYDEVNHQVKLIDKMLRKLQKK